jgi:hypothetical protein
VAPVEKLSSGKILCGPVGSGKSLVAAAYYMKVEADADVYVITTAKKRDSLDWEEEFARVGIGKALDQTRAGTLTVDSWNNIGKYADVQGAFFIFDEQRLVGSGQWTHVFLALAKRNRWILLSATPGDTWLDYIPVFVANGFYKNRTEFKRRHVVYSSYTKFPKVERYMEVGHLVRLRNSLLVEMKYPKHTVRHEVLVKVDHDKELLDEVLKKRWNPFSNAPMRDVAELFSVARRVVNSAPSRLSAVEKLLERHPRLIVFYNFNYELEALRSLATRCRDGLGDLSEKNKSTKTATATRTKMTDDGLSGRPIETETTVRGTRLILSTTSLTVAEWNGHKHEAIPETDRWLYLVQYTAGAEGWNCTDTDATCFYSLNYSWKVSEQSRGRIDRLNTLYTDLYYYTLMSNSVVDFAVQSALKEKRSFNEKRFVAQILKPDTSSDHMSVL